MQYIVAYNNNISLIEKVYKPDSYTIIGGRYVILNYSENQGFLEVDESVYPKCYGLADSDLLDEIGVSNLRDISYLELFGNGVLIGILDDGFDIRASALRNADGTTKFEAYYNQSTGLALDQEQINSILAVTGPAEAVNSESLELSKRAEANMSGEETVIEENFSNRENMQHGSMLASIICSDEEGEFTGIAPNSSIIGVALKRADPEMYSHYNIPISVKAYSEADIIEGIEYITRVAGARPLVLLLPFESSLGAHTGSGILEEYANWINRQLHRAVITTAGNQAISKGHTYGRIMNNLGENNGFNEIAFLVNQDRTDTFINIVMTEGTRPLLTIESPTGEIKRVTSYKDTVNFLFEQSVFQVKTTLFESRSGKCMIYIRANNLVTGIWKMYLQVENEGWEIEYNLYLPIETFTQERVEFMSPVSEQTITSPGDAMIACTVGCYDGKTDRIYPPSGKRISSVKPDFCAPGVNVLAYDALTGGVSTFTGTSVSVAVTAGVAALILQWAVVENKGPYITGTGLKQLLITGCRSVSAYVPENQWGYGALNLYGSFEAIRNLQDIT